MAARDFGLSLWEMTRLGRCACLTPLRPSTTQLGPPIPMGSSTCSTRWSGACREGSRRRWGRHRGSDPAASRPRAWVIPYDPGPAMLGRAIERTPNLPVVVVDAARVPIRSSSVDLVCSPRAGTGSTRPSVRAKRAGSCARAATGRPGGAIPGPMPSRGSTSTSRSSRSDVPALPDINATSTGARRPWLLRAPLLSPGVTSWSGKGGWRSRTG